MKTIELSTLQKDVMGLIVAFDGCHKFYICETVKDTKEAEDNGGYKMYPLTKLPELWEKSCPLRFLSNWKLNKQFVAQGENAKFITKGRKNKK